MALQNFVTRRRVRFGDCDPGGILYTPRIGYFVVEAVLDFLSDRLGGPAERRILAMGVAPPARALSVEFLHPMAWDDELDIHVCVEEMRTSAMTFSVNGFAAQQKVFVASITLVCIDRESRRAVDIPAELRSVLE